MRKLKIEEVQEEKRCAMDDGKRFSKLFPEFRSLIECKRLEPHQI